MNPIKLPELEVRPREGLDYEGVLALQKDTSVLHGPPVPAVGPHSLIVLTTVKNGELYIKSFMEHYLQLGVSHFVFLDNGSTDRTLELCGSYPNVTLLQTRLPYKRYFHAMNQFLLEQYGRLGWCLVADIDEFFDFPYSSVLGIQGLLQYLDQNSFTAVAAQMLDMFSGEPLSQISSHPDDSLKEKFRFCDITQVTVIQNIYDKRNLISNPKILRFGGGIRKKAFGLDAVCLTKHPLLLCRPPLCLWNPHFVFHARVADLSCLVFHYKFLGSFIAYTKESVQQENHWNKSSEYKVYDAVLNQNPGLTLKTETAMELPTLDSLVDVGFLVVSERYREFVAQWKGERHAH